jgi:Flp pilus assembly protein CpaB
MGAFAAFALLNYIRGIEDDVYEDRRPVDVLIADEDIPAGTPAVEALAMMEVKAIPLEIRPANIVDPDLTESIAGLIALNDIPANQIIIPGLFVDATVVQQSFKDQIPSGQVAISLNVDDVRAVGGNLQPGDEVNILIIHENVACGQQQEEEATDGEEETEEPDRIFSIPGEDDVSLADGEYCTYTQPARYLYQRVEILKIGSRELLQPGQTTDETAAAGGGGTITFMVPNDAAQIIASVSPSDIYLTLLPEDYEAVPLPALSFEFFEGPTPAEDPEQLTPYGVDGFVDGDAGLVSADPSDTEEG